MFLEKVTHWRRAIKSRQLYSWEEGHVTSCVPTHFYKHISLAKVTDPHFSLPILSPLLSSSASCHLSLTLPSSPVISVISFLPSPLFSSSHFLPSPLPSSPLFCPPVLSSLCSSPVVFFHLTSTLLSFPLLSSPPFPLSLYCHGWERGSRENKCEGGGEAEANPTDIRCDWHREREGGPEREREMERERGETLLY